MNTVSKLLIGTLLVSGLPARAAEEAPRVGTVDDEIRDRFKLKDDFYKKYVSADGLIIMSSENVRDTALLETRHLVLKVLEGREDIIKSMITKNLRICVMAYNEFTTDMPETRKMNPWWDKRARGLGGNPVSCAEENLLNFRGDPYRGENIFIHEFAHAIHHSGMNVIDKTFNERLKKLFLKSKESGKYSGYAIVSHGELWAEGVQSWFHCNTGGLGVKVGGKRKAIMTREEMEKHFPELAAMMKETFGDNDWTYTTTDRRLDQPHLRGYDPSKAPVFKWPKKVLEDARREEERRRRKKRAGKKGT